MKRVISYIRFSSEKQAKGDSLRRQSKMVTDWLKAHPEYYLDQDLSFRDLGVSGFTGKHLKGGLGDFLTAIEKGLVKAGDTLLIESLDRLSRQAVDRASELLRNILRSGVDVVTQYNSCSASSQGSFRGLLSWACITQPLINPLSERRATTPEREAPFLTDLLNDLYRPCSR